MTAFVPLTEADPECGGKAEVLGSLSRSGFAVPMAAVLPAGSAVDVTAWESELPAVLAELGGESFAVRSSGLGEDGRATSFAGQFHTSLGVRAEDVEREIRRTLLARDRAATYAEAVGVPAPGRVAVIVQRMLAPEAAGVAFTRDPVTGERVTLVEAMRGLGEPLVSGRVSPQTDALTMTQTREVAGVAERIEAALGGGQDVEWAIAGARVWVLQARPITTNGSAALPAEGSRSDAVVPETGLSVSGTPASPGTASGMLRVVRGPGDFTRLRRGDVLVCRATSPAWMSVLARASAVVTERGGVLSHAAIVARELRIPAITDVRKATELPDGVQAVVDGTVGTLRTLAHGIVGDAR